MLIRKLIVSTVTLFIFMSSGINFSFAHAQLISTIPAANSNLDSLPTKVVLEFGEQMLDFVDGNQISVLNPNGIEVTTGKTELNGAIIYREISSEIISGRYKVSYRAISNDGHKVTGDFYFVISPVKHVATPQKIVPSPIPSNSSLNFNVKHKQIVKDKFSLSHLFHKHAQHIFLTILLLILVTGWTLYRRFTQRAQ